jgi:glutamate-5-semialdehyde dehydrogenase
MADDEAKKADIEAIRRIVREIAERAKAVTPVLRGLTRTEKDRGLRAMARYLLRNEERILKANEVDVERAKKAGLTSAIIDRLRLSPDRLKGMVKGIEDLIQLPDPVGEVVRMWTRPNGLQVGKMRIPIGVVAVIYESRPNVTSDAAGICFKSGNAVILRGGSEAFSTNTAIVEVLREALVEEKLPPDAVQFLPDTHRESIYELIQLDGLVDLVIPRGGEEMIREITRRSRVPTLKHDRGVCHVYVDRDALPERALEIVINAKTQRPGVCNAMETLLVDELIAPTFVPLVVQALREGGVRIKGCPRSLAIVGDLELASEEDFYREYLDLVMNLKIVSGWEEAAEHIEKYGTHHTDAIVTQNWDRALRFVRRVDSSLVLVNASTRFNDGGELGLGAEIGINTSKFHAFGPMSLEELTITKFIAFGTGQIRT